MLDWILRSKVEEKISTWKDTACKNLNCILLNKFAFAVVIKILVKVHLTDVESKIKFQIYAE